MQIQCLDPLVQRGHFRYERLAFLTQEIVSLLQQLALLGVFLQIQHRLVDKLGLAQANQLQFLRLVNNLTVVGDSLVYVEMCQLRGNWRGIG
jgi:hypothetical protein